ncbi:MAG: hypothetical protein K2X27_19400 [Candidatus Obscuribacterales bacterium]|nr:hypothetical protein [Candidatus Obscuribacterales bacterium]
MASVKKSFGLFLLALCLELPDNTKVRAESSMESVEQYLALDRKNQQRAYIGNINSMKFHLCSCEFALLMARKRRIGFDHAEEARFSGMRACRWCLPPYCFSVEGRILQGGQETRKPAPYMVPAQ